ENLKPPPNYTFRGRNKGPTLDGAGKSTKDEVQTSDVTPIAGSPYRRLTGRDDKPLPEKDEPKAQEKLRTTAEQRRRESPAARERRIGEYTRKREKQRATMREVLDAFDFRLAATERLEGREQYVVEATPHPGYRPRTRNAAFFPKVRGKLWIDRQDYHWT